MRKLSLILAMFALFFLLCGFVVWGTVEQNQEEVVIIENFKNEKGNQGNLGNRGNAGQKVEENVLGGEMAGDDFSQGSQEVGMLSVNGASEEELDTIPGVGPATIQKIIDGRPWENVEDVLLLINKQYREEARERIRI